MASPAPRPFPLRAAPPLFGFAVVVLVLLAALLATAAVAAVTAGAPFGLVVLLSAGALLPVVTLVWYARRAAWLDGTVLTRRGLGGTSRVDLAGAHVELHTTPTQRLLLRAHRPAGGTSITVPLRHDYGRGTGPLVANDLLAALADAIDPTTDEHTATTVATLRRLALSRGV